MQKQSNNLLTVIAFLTFIGFGLGAGLMGVIWPSMRDTFGVHDEAYGALMLVTMIGSLVVTMYSGVLLGRLGVGRSLLISSLAGVLGALGGIFAPNWVTFVTIQGAAAMGAALLSPAINTYFATHESAGRMNWLHACFGLGATISPAIMAGVLQAGGSWRAGYVITGAMSLVLAVIFGLTLNRWPKAIDPATRDEVASAGGHTLALPAVWLSLLMFFVFTGMEGSSGQWSFTLFTEGRGIDAATAGTWISIYWASMTLGRIVFGWVVRRVRASTLVRWCMGGALAGAMAIWLAPWPAVGFAGLALTGFCLAPLFPVLTSNTPERLGKAHAANTIGYQITAVKLGLALIPSLGGLLSAHMGVASIGPFLAAVAATAFLLHEATLRVARPERR